jgi:lysozyme
MALKISDNGKKLLAKWEGIEHNVYDDAVGLPTIGVGHLLTKDELSSHQLIIEDTSVNYDNGLNDEQVYGLLAQDLNRFETTVDDSVTVDLAQNQFDALVSFSFNIGTGAFKDSTLLKHLNGGDYNDVPNQLLRWVKAKGKTLPGLVNRRENEIKLWKGEI